MDGLFIGTLMVLAMATVPVAVAIVVLREGSAHTRRQRAFAELATRCGLTPGVPTSVAPPDTATLPYGSPVELTGDRGGVRVGARRVNGPLDDQGFGVQVWAEVPDLGFGLSTSPATVSGGPKVNPADPRVTRALYLQGSGIAARASLSHAVRSALLPLLSAGRVSVGAGRVVTVTREREPKDADELTSWLDEVATIAARLSADAVRPIPTRLADAALHDPEPAARLDAAEALAGLPPGMDTTEALTALRAADDPHVAVLAELADGDLPAVAARITASPEVGERVIAALALSLRGAALPSLAASLRTSPAPLGEWLVGVVRIGGPGDRDAASVLGQVGGIEEVTGLAAIEGDPDAAGRAREALEQIRGRLRPLAGRVAAVEGGGEVGLVEEEGRVRVVE